MSHLDSIREASRVSPENVPLLLLLARTCMEEFAADEALEAFQKILTLIPGHEEAKLGLACALHQVGKTSEAIVRLEAFVSEFPSHGAAWLQLSRFLMAEGQRDAARECYEKSLKLPGSKQDVGLEQEIYIQSNVTEPPSAREKGRVTSEGWEGLGKDGNIESDAMELPDINFESVGGMESVKEEIRMKILYPLKNPDLFKAYGKKAGGGVLLYGPPGCGKTLISRAAAGEIRAHFLPIGIHQILDLYIGESEKNLHQIFETARDNAPAILFFDEVDALAADRRDLRKCAGRTLINQFLAEMDGTASANEGVLILGATNAPWHIDPAFRRPGRFDRLLFVPPPDEAARAAILRVLSQGKPTSELDIALLARKTKDFSGADLKAIFDSAIERGLAQAMKSGQIVPLTTRDLLDAVGRLKPTTKAWFESARNYALYANQGGFYNDILSYLGLQK